MTLTSFRMNTYEKQGEGGTASLTLAGDLASYTIVYPAPNLSSRAQRGTCFFFRSRLAKVRWRVSDRKRLVSALALRGKQAGAFLRDGPIFLGVDDEDANRRIGERDFLVGG
jgi:hypothetical protein